MGRQISAWAPRLSEIGVVGYGMLSAPNRVWALTVFSGSGAELTAVRHFGKNVYNHFLVGRGFSRARWQPPGWRPHLRGRRHIRGHPRGRRQCRRIRHVPCHIRRVVRRGGRCGGCRPPVPHVHVAFADVGAADHRPPATGRRVRRRHRTPRHPAPRVPFPPLGRETVIAAVHQMRAAGREVDGRRAAARAPRLREPRVGRGAVGRAPQRLPARFTEFGLLITAGIHTAARHFNNSAANQIHNAREQNRRARARAARPGGLAHSAHAVQSVRLEQAGKSAAASAGA